MLNFPEDLNNLSAILTHLHWDHINDIFNILYGSYAFHNLKRIDKPINVYLPGSPNNIAKVIVGETNSFAKYHTIFKSFDLQIGDMKITFCNTDHPYETYAVKVQTEGKSIVYTSDTSFSAKDRLVEFAKNTDLLISESSLLIEHGFPEICSHLTAMQAATIAKEADAKSLLLNHFWPEEDENKYLSEARKVFERISIATKGTIIEI
jgi:ribonuclease BN (tRNA processing enzyme)